jgi:hypothetical protein
MIPDYEEGYRIDQANEAYELLERFLESKDGKRIFPKHKEFLDYLLLKELYIDELKEKIHQYESFFNTLKGFLPRDFSIHDPIG